MGTAREVTILDMVAHTLLEEEEAFKMVILATELILEVDIMGCCQNGGSHCRREL
jgi:hypothetical protein